MRSGSRPRHASLPEGFRSFEVTGDYNARVTPVHTRPDVSYAGPDGAQVIVWSKQVTSYARNSSPGTGLRTNSPRDDVYLMRHLVRDSRKGPDR